MICDTQEQFSVAQSLIVGTGDTVSTNVYDTGAAADVGAGEPLYIHAKIGTAVASGGAGTMQIVLQDSADNSSFADVMALTPAMALAAMTANKEVARSRLPVGLRRYLRLVYRVGTAALTAGTVTSQMVKDVQAQQYGASGFTVA